LFPAQYLGHYPNHPIILTGYGEILAQDFSRDMRGVINSDEYQQLFPGVRIDPSTSAVNNWRLAKPHKGRVRAASMYGSITGSGAMLMGIDDPIKSREEAESATWRLKAQQAYKTTLSTRLHNDAIVLVCLTRWHSDDLAGWLMAQNLGFRYIRLPGIADGMDITGKKKQRDLLGRKKGQVLWPKKFPEKMLLEQKKLLGNYDYSALYDQRPTSIEGIVFNRGFFKIIDEQDIPSGLRWVRFWDLAISEQTAGDFTASARGAMDPLTGRVYFDGTIHGKWPWPTVRRRIKAVALAERGLTLMTGIESGGTQGGMAQEMQMDKELAGIGVIPIPCPTSKMVRALPAIARGEAGLLYLVKGDWNEGWIDEHVEFDKGLHDDRVDVTSGVVRMLGFGGHEIKSLGRILEDQGEAHEQQQRDKQAAIKSEASVIRRHGIVVQPAGETPEAEQAVNQAELPWWVRLKIAQDD